MLLDRKLGNSSNQSRSESPAVLPKDQRISSQHLQATPILLTNSRYKNGGRKPRELGRLRPGTSKNGASCSEQRTRRPIDGCNGSSLLKSQRTLELTDVLKRGRGNTLRCGSLAISNVNTRSGKEVQDTERIESRWSKRTGLREKHATTQWQVNEPQNEEGASQWGNRLRARARWNNVQLDEREDGRVNTTGVKRPLDVSQATENEQGQADMERDPLGPWLKRYKRNGRSRLRLSEDANDDPEMSPEDLLPKDQNIQSDSSFSLEGKILTVEVPVFRDSSEEEARKASPSEEKENLSFDVMAKNYINGSPLKVMKEAVEPVGKTTEDETSAQDDSNSSDRGLEPGLPDTITRPVVIEGRRCGLCGLGSEPPEKEVSGTGTVEVGRDGTTLSGVTKKGKGGLGRLLGPLSDRMGVAAVWVHQECAIWSPEVYFLGLGCLKNVRAALRRGRFLKCSRCGQPGATTGCRVDRCHRTYHLPCARLSGCSFDHRRYLMSCAEHLHLFRHQQKKRIRETVIGLWDDQITKKNLNDRRLAGEDKVGDNAEDEEFQKRERKRLQRDLARLAPVKLDGSSQCDALRYGGWESVGGLQNVVQCLKEMVTLPLLYPETFQKVGIVPPRGVLLHGYPGTGKTLVVRALLGACARGQQKIAYFARKGADCLGKYVGDSERQLRLLFQLAEQSQPSIIFFDEIDGLAPKRSKNQDQTQSSVVSTLLALMDGLSSRGSVVVIGATNRPDALDPALRRPGRFDREIYFPLPSVADREAILAVHTKKWIKPPSHGVLSLVSKATSGFAGADLQALCTQAAMIALKRVVSLRELLNSADGSGILPEVHVKAADWIVALAQAPAPCSRRMLGNALSEVYISPLPYHVVPVLLKPALAVLEHLESDGRFSLPSSLVKPLALVKKLKLYQRAAVLSVEDVEAALGGTGMIIPNVQLSSDEVGVDGNNGVEQKQMNTRGERTFRIMLTGGPKHGQNLVAASILHVFQSFTHVYVLSVQTMIQGGSGEILEGLIRILGEARAAPSMVYMPRIDSWAMEEVYEAGQEENKTVVSSRAWGIFMQQTSLFPVHLPLMFLATYEIHNTEIPSDILSFFADQHTSLKATVVPCACIQIPLPTENEILEIFNRASKGLSEGLTMRFITTVQATGQTKNSQAEMKASMLKTQSEIRRQPKTAESSKDTSAEQPSRLRSALQDAIRCCGYQLLHYPHFMGIRQATFRLGAGPCLTLENPYTGSWVIRDLTGAKSDHGDKNAGTHGNNNGPDAEKSDGRAELNTIETDKDNTVDKDAALVDEKSADIDTGIADRKVEPNDGVEPVGPKANRDGSNEDAVADTDMEDQLATVWGLDAVGLKACKGFYQTGSEVVLDLKKVVEALRDKLDRKLKRGMDQWRCCQLLTQAATLQDLAECWAHELSRLDSRDKKPAPFENSHVPIQAACESQAEGGRQVVDQSSPLQPAQGCFESPGCAERPAKQQKMHFQPDSLEHLRGTVKQLLLDVWEKHGSHSSIEEIHDLISETSVTVFSEFERYESGRTCECGDTCSGRDNAEPLSLSPIMKILASVRAKLGL